MKKRLILLTIRVNANIAQDIFPSNFKPLARLDGKEPLVRRASALSGGRRATVLNPKVGLKRHDSWLVRRVAIIPVCSQKLSIFTLDFSINS